jgi:type IV secretory pathway protease TraF
VNVVEAITAVGVPEIAPVEVFNVKPAGSAGLIEYDVTVPVTAGVFVVIACPTVTVTVVCG